jgi:hypothetical protein
MQNGFQDTFTATAMAALEVGAMAYAEGLIAHQWQNYVRYDGLIVYRAEELAQQARMLTILALFHSYSSNIPKADAVLLACFDKAKTMANWLVAKNLSSFSLRFLLGNSARSQFFPGGGEQRSAIVSVGGGIPKQKQQKLTMFERFSTQILDRLIAYSLLICMKNKQTPTKPTGWWRGGTARCSTAQPTLASV